VDGHQNPVHDDTGCDFWTWRKVINSEAKPNGQDGQSWPYLGRMVSGAPDTKTALIVLFAACMVLATALRLFQLGTSNFWYDEAETIGYATNLFPIRDIHPPTYYAIVHVVMQLGISEFWVRLPSFLMGVAAVAMVFSIGRMIVSNQVALIATLLVSISPILIWHSQDARMYSQVILGCLLIVYFYIQILRRGTTLDWVGYVFAALFAAYTQLYAVLLIGVLNLHLLIFHRHLLMRWIVAQVLLVLGYAPWIIFLVTMPPEQIGGAQRTLAAFPYTFFAFTNGYTLGPSILELRTFSLGTLVPYLPLIVPIMLAVAILFVAGAVYLWRNNRETAALIILWAVLPAVIGVAVPFIVRSMTYNVRYVLFSVPAFLLILAGGVVSLKRYRLGSVLLVVVILYNSISLYNHFADGRYAKEDVRSAAEFVAANASAEDHILVITVDRLFRWYYEPDNLIVSNPASATTDQIFNTAISGTDRVWLVESRPWQSDPKQTLKTLFDNQYPVISQVDFPGVKVYQYCIQDCPPA
jgi:mannosyltransferase